MFLFRFALLLSLLFFQYFFPRGVIRSISFLSQVNATSVNSNEPTNKQTCLFHPLRAANKNWQKLQQLTTRDAKGVRVARYFRNLPVSPRGW